MKNELDDIIKVLEKSIPVAAEKLHEDGEWYIAQDLEMALDRLKHLQKNSE